ncbi:hypothetical protein EZV62_003927 [Acer yangbiense]|uniref:At1g61320/AtMIF1 LRR domain-containing protein n=1 Tax=Acer yangbiense TaxID=1000413 RepID=A0A5C7IK21_9ROSI|nr:hypothetical protein EZV62_003927 [Acer yangbiense]
MPWNSIIRVFAKLGRHFHDTIRLLGFEFDVFVESSLVKFHVESGLISHKTKKISPNAVTLASVLPACSSLAALKLGKGLHGNILKNGLDKKCYVGIAITDMYSKCERLDLAHKTFGRVSEKDVVCWNKVDLYCSVGRLNEAFEIINSMPFPHDAGVGETLLRACRAHGNVELAEVASRHLWDWGNALKIRKLMKERGVQKVPGYSWIEIRKTTHMFVAADESYREDFAFEEPRGFSKNDKTRFRKGIIKFIEYVNVSLLRFCELKFSMLRFRLCIGLLDFDQMVSILDKWIELMVKSEVKEVDFDFLSDEYVMYTLPSFFFAKSVNTISLGCCKLDPPSDNMRLNSLKSVTLAKVCIYGDAPDAH